MIEALGEFGATLVGVVTRQAVVGFGVLAVLGVGLSAFQVWTCRYLSEVVGWRGVVVWTGWLGTPVHELSHVAAAFVCRLRIREVRLWDPDPEDGVLGYVRYEVPRLTWRTWPKVLGTVLVGVAPLFGGALVLWGALQVLAPTPEQTLERARAFAEVMKHGAAQEVASGYVELVRGVYGAVFADGWGSWRGWVFAYVALAVGAHLAPSRADVRGCGAGLCVLAVVWVVVDAGLLLGGVAPEAMVEPVARWTGPLAALLTVAFVVCSVNLAVAFVLAYTVPRRRRG